MVQNFSACPARSLLLAQRGVLKLSFLGARATLPMQTSISHSRSCNMVTKSTKSGLLWLCWPQKMLKFPKNIYIRWPAEDSMVVCCCSDVSKNRFDLDSTIGQTFGHARDSVYLTAKITLLFLRL